jgi:hypothetical protein
LKARDDGWGSKREPKELVTTYSVCAGVSRAEGASEIQRWKKLRIVTYGFQVGDRSLDAPISLYTVVARTQGYTYAAQVWDLSIVQGPFSVAPYQTLIVRFALVPTFEISTFSEILRLHDATVVADGVACRAVPRVLR